MYQPSHFAMVELTAIQDVMAASSLAHFVTWTGEELIATPLPVFLVRGEGEYGTLYGHVAKANNQWSRPVGGEALVIFPHVDAYVSPSWYATKKETGKVVPTWNYEVVHAYGVPEFFQDEARLLELVTRLTQQNENGRSTPWKVNDAPADFIRSQLRSIVGFRLPISRLQGKRKMSQNRTLADREGVARGLREEGNEEVAKLIPQDK